MDGLRLKAAGRVQHILFASGLGLGVLGFVPFALGLAAVLSWPVLAAAYGFVLLLGLWGWVRFWRSDPPTWSELSRRLGGLSWLTWVLVAFLGLLGGINLLAALAPVIGVDEFIYRVAAANLYLRHERLFYIPSMWLHQQPSQVQMLQLWGMALASDSTAQVVQWGMGGLVVLALVDVARRGMPLVWALLGAAVFYSYSDVIVLSGRASPDLAGSLFMVLSVVAWLQWMETGKGRWLWIAGALAGFFAASTRVPGAYGAIALAVLVAFSGWRHFGWSPTWALGRGLGVGFLAFLVVLPWYVKTYGQTGSPIWPFLMPVFGARDWTMPAYDYVMSIQERAIGQWMSARRILTASWDLTLRPGLFNSGVVGPLLLAALPLALVVRMSRRWTWLLAAGVALVPFWYVAYPRLRAFIPGVALLSIVAVYLLWRLWKEDQLPLWVPKVMVVIVTAWLLVGLGTAVRWHGQAALVTLGFQDEEAYLSQRLVESDIDFYWYDDYQTLNQDLPDGSRLLIYDSRGYHLDFDYDHYSLISKREERPERLRDPMYASEKVRELGSDYVLLWPEPRYTTAFEPSNYLEATLYDLCGSDWPVVYRSDTMIVCQTQPASAEARS